jgi:hypothetical protein
MQLAQQRRRARLDHDLFVHALTLSPHASKGTLSGRPPQGGRIFCDKFSLFRFSQHITFFACMQLFLYI